MTNMIVVYLHMACKWTKYRIHTDKAYWTLQRKIFRVLMLFHI